MKMILLIAVLLLPSAVAATAPGNGVLPVPGCYPCNEFPVALAANVLPVPGCYPCNEFPVALAANVLPVPGCYPCNEFPVASAHATLLHSSPHLIASLRRKS